MIKMMITNGNDNDYNNGNDKNDNINNSNSNDINDMSFNGSRLVVVI